MRQTCISTGLINANGPMVVVVHTQGEHLSGQNLKCVKNDFCCPNCSIDLELPTCVSRVLLSFRELLIIC